jgi:hypothetical protein
MGQISTPPNQPLKPLLPQKGAGGKIPIERSQHLPNTLERTRRQTFGYSFDNKEFETGFV